MSKQKLRQILIVLVGGATVLTITILTDNVILLVAGLISMVMFAWLFQRADRKK